MHAATSAVTPTPMPTPMPILDPDESEAVASCDGCGVRDAEVVEDWVFESVAEPRLGTELVVAAGWVVDESGIVVVTPMIVNAVGASITS